MRIIKPDCPLPLSKEWNQEYFGDEKTKTEEWKNAILAKAKEIEWFEVDGEGEEYLNKLDEQAKDAVQTQKTTQASADAFKQLVVNRIVESHVSFIVMWEKRSVPTKIEDARKISVIEVIAGWMRAEHDMIED